MDQAKQFSQSILAVLFSLALAIVPHAAQAQTTGLASPFSLETLGNATYHSEYVEGGEVTHNQFNAIRS